MHRMISKLILGLSLGAFLWIAPYLVFAAKPKPSSYIKVLTSKGEIIVKLYDQTPKHKENFLKLVKEKTLNHTIFHRVIKDFMIQGGDPDSKSAKKGQLLGGGDLGYKIDAEFVDTLFHKKGVLSAARDNNPRKASSASQFYIVQGKKYSDRELDEIEMYKLEGKKIPAKQREIYKTIGGTPFLDQNYTVFGEVVKGIEVVDKIAEEKTDRNDRPETDVKMQLELLKKKEVRKLLKELRK